MVVIFNRLVCFVQLKGGSFETSSLLTALLCISPASTMAATSTRAKNTISLKGSSAIVAEYFNYAVNKWVGKGEATATAAAVIENNVCTAHHTSVLPWHLLQHSIPARDIPNRQLSAGAALWAEHDGVQGPGPNSLPADSHQADVKCVAARLAASAIQSCTSGTGYRSRPWRTHARPCSLADF